MVCKIIDFVLKVLNMSRFKICRTIAISKFEFFDLLGIERVKKSKTNKNHSKSPNLVIKSLLKRL